MCDNYNKIGLFFIVRGWKHDISSVLPKIVYTSILSVTTHHCAGVSCIYFEQEAIGVVCVCVLFFFSWEEGRRFAYHVIITMNTYVRYACVCLWCVHIDCVYQITGRFSVQPKHSFSFSSASTHATNMNVALRNDGFFFCWFGKLSEKKHQKRKKTVQ